MKRFISIIFILSIMLSHINANSLNDKAFNAYKSKNYKTALKYYIESAKSQDIKALLMLGLFFEKGLGVQKNEQKAIKFYKNILKRTSNIKRIILNKEYKKANITIAALNRLYTLENNSKYKMLADKISKVKNGTTIEKSELFSDDSVKDDYLILCPNAELVAPEDREGIEDFDCALFEHFPKKMALFMHLRHLKFKLLDLPDSKKQKVLPKLDKKLKDLVKPMIEYLEKEVVTCYTNAIDLNDIRSCDYDYLLKTDPLLFDSASYKMEQKVLGSKLENHELEPFEKEGLIDTLVDKIVKGTYAKEWRDK